MIVGLTGGIGSGKTTVASLFKELGVPVYIADDKAKVLMNTSETLRQEIQELLGVEAYKDGKLNRPYIADKVFNDKELLQNLNAIVHPAVADHFNSWRALQNAPYVIKEAAILFENDSYKHCDFMLLITAPLQQRIERVRKRDKITEEEVMDRVKNQWSDARKISLSDAVIENIFLEDVKTDVLRIHNHLKIRISRGW